MEDDSNPGRDVEVRIGGRVFGISNKSETHSKLSDDNNDFRISHFMYYGDDGDFGGKVKEHIEDYDFILNLRAYEGISPTTGERAMCYRVYKMDSTALHRLTEQKYPFEGRYSTETFYAPSPPYPPYQEIKVQKKGNSIAIPSIPIGLAELQAAFWVPLPPGRGRQKKDGN